MSLWIVNGFFFQINYFFSPSSSYNNTKCFLNKALQKETTEWQCCYTTWNNMVVKMYDRAAELAIDRRNRFNRQLNLSISFEPGKWVDLMTFEFVIEQSFFNVRSNFILICLAKYQISFISKMLQSVCSCNSYKIMFKNIFFCPVTSKNAVFSFYESDNRMTRDSLFSAASRSSPAIN